MFKSLLLLVFLALSNILVAQKATDLAIGEWKLLLPYSEVKSVTHSADKLFFASKYSVVSRDKTDGSLVFYDLVSGLSETDIRMIKYDKISKSLFIVYQNSQIDILRDGEVSALPIIKNKEIIGDKFIYDIFFAGNIAYLSCGFGVVGLNTSTLEVSFSTFTEKPVKGVTILNSELYASVTDGIYHIAKNDANIQDFLYWEKLALSSFSANLLGSLNGELYFGANDRLLSYDIDNQSVDTIFEGLNQHITKLTQEDEGLLVTFFCDGPSNWDDCDGRIIYISPSGNSKEIKKPDTFRPIDAIQDGDDIWVGDQWYPYRKISLNGGHIDVFTVDAPFSQRAFETKVVDDTLYVVAGTWSPTKSFPGGVVADGLFFQDLQTAQWGYVNRVNYPVLKDSLADYNFMDIEINPTTKKKYIASFGGGIIEKQGEHIKVFNKTNSSLRPEPGYDTRISVIDLAFDSGENLWATNYYASNPLSVLKPDGSWQSFNLGASNVATNRMVIDDYDNKWIVIVSKGLLVLNTGVSLNDLSDDEYKVFTLTNSELQSNTINDLAIDQDGSIWVATDKGVVVFECGNDVFGEFCKGARRIASLDGFNAYLLDDEKVNSVMVDPANRKWFGTTNGVFVLSPSGEEVIATYNIENSPLPDNDIQSLSVDEKTGTVYIGTSFGLASYRSDALEGGFVHKDDVYAYPNPVQPDYTGPIAITGLAQNANVKITDVEGRLVFETQALGGQAIWDGKDYNHQKVTSGVYLVFSTSEPGLSVDAAVAKIVVVN